MDDGLEALDLGVERGAGASGDVVTDGQGGGGERPVEAYARSADLLPPEEPEVVRQQGREELRGELFTDLDRLAFALEMEAAEALDAGDEDRAVRLEDQRLGVRLAQRLVSGVHAHEVQPRLDRAAEAYDRRTR